MSKTYRQCYAWGYGCLAEADVADARLDARLLLEFVCGTSQHDMILNGDRPLTDTQWSLYQEYIEKRSRRIPLQHITGTQDFMGFTFFVNEHVLIPRQDTEILVEVALEKLSQYRKSKEEEVHILDMCTGNGCILLSLLALGNKTTQGQAEKVISGIGVDISGEALKVAERNLVNISRQCGKALQAVFVESNLFETLQDKDRYTDLERSFDMIVSNPPYIATEVIGTLEPEVRLHEPLGALDGTADGLYFYKRIVTDSTAFLKKGGMLLFEIGYDQGTAVADLMRTAGFAGVTVRKDYAGLDRVVYGFFEEEI